MAHLMRPGSLWRVPSYHRRRKGKTLPAVKVCDVTGSLCENNDKFAIDRKLPEMEIGDIVVIHDAGAHGPRDGF